MRHNIYLRTNETKKQKQNHLKTIKKNENGSRRTPGVPVETWYRLGGEFFGTEKQGHEALRVEYHYFYLVYQMRENITILYKIMQFVGKYHISSLHYSMKNE